MTARAGGRSGLLRLTDAERARTIDLSRRLHDRARIGIALVILALVAGVPSFGWAPLPLVVAAAALFHVLQGRMDRYRRPEYALAISWVAAQATVAAIIVVAEGPRELLFALFAFPLMLVSVVWPTRLVVLATGMTSVLLVAVALLAHGDTVMALPPVLVTQLALLIATALVASITRDAELVSRQSAVVDRLTGTLNRAALEARGPELEHQSATTGREVAVIVGDLDHFKQVNDVEGHARGDLVLAEVAYRMRKALPAFAGVYRYGGEEFVVLLPDTSAEAAVAVAERMRCAVGEEPVLGLTITMSFGVAASRPGGRFDFGHVLARADEALYDAKRGGRDRTCRAQDAAPVAALRRTPARERRSGADEPAPAPDRPAEPAAVTARAGLGHTSWLADPLQREHLLDLTRRLRHANHVPYAVAFIGVLVLAASYGWAILIPVAAGAIVYRAVEANLGRFARPEYALGAAWMLAQAANGLGFVVATERADDVSTFALPILLTMVVGSSAVFPTRGVVLGAFYTAAIMVLAIAEAEPAALAERPWELGIVMALLAAMALVGSAIGQSAVQHHGAAVVDRLTGLLNRRALEARVSELAHHAAAAGETVAVVVGDVDRFKQVNDRHGHPAGDAVLRAVAQRLRGELRAFEGLYRFGGEEFVVVLAGASTPEAAVTAERLRAAIERAPLGGLDLTMSFGVAVSAPGERFDFDATFDRADAALYRAKHEGRNRVCAASLSAGSSGTARAA